MAFLKKKGKILALKKKNVKFLAIFLHSFGNFPEVQVESVYLKKPAGQYPGTTGVGFGCLGGAPSSFLHT